MTKKEIVDFMKMIFICEACRKEYICFLEKNSIIYDLNFIKQGMINEIVSIYLEIAGEKEWKGIY